MISHHHCHHDAHSQLHFIFLNHSCHDEWASLIICQVYSFSFPYSKHYQQRKAPYMSRFPYSKHWYHCSKTDGTRTQEGLPAEDCVQLVCSSCHRVSWV